MTKNKNGNKETVKKRTVKRKLKFDIRYLALILTTLVLTYIIGMIVVGNTFALILVACVGLLLFIARRLDKAKDKKRQKKIINRILIVLLSLMIITVLAIGGFAIYIIKSAPEFDVSLLNLKEASILYDKDGNEITKLGSQLREKIEYKELPQVVIDALIATEDSRFFQHNGIDAPRFVKAVIGQLAGKSNAGGGSTLSMQVVKNSFTSFNSTGIEGIIRKFTDIYLAVFKLEKNYTKQQIIEFYLNNHPLGNNSYGIEQASQSYFGKNCGELTLTEAALLVGLYNAPTANNPYVYPENATDRRNTVLNLMVKHGYITQDEADLANSIPVQSLLVEKSKKTLAYQGYIDTVIEELEDKYSIYPYRTSVLVYTNMDRGMQAKIDDIYNGVTFKWENDVVESGSAVIEVDTGKIVAIGAGRNKTSARTYNYATQISRQIGSTAKPIFDYGPGMEYLNWNTFTQFIDEPWAYTNGPNINNSDGSFWGPISLRTAMAQSRNIPALKAFQMIDNKKILSFAESLGLKPEATNGYVHEAHALGSFNGSNPLEMTAAYAAFANGGYYIEPLTVNKVVYRDTGEAKTFESKKEKVMSDSTAYMITDTLLTAVNNGLSSGAKISKVNVAAKTGTTSFTDAIKNKYGLKNAVNDAWIVGYDPEYAIGMWYGYQNIDSKYYSTSTSAVVQRGKLYRALGNAVFTKNNQKFKVPDSVIQVDVEVGTSPALLADSKVTPKEMITKEYFKKGTEPTDYSTNFNTLPSVNNLNVTYSEEDVATTITWSPLESPISVVVDGIGKFGYHVYLNDTLLGFTTENTMTIERPTVIAGTYKVITAYETYMGNQSAPSTFTYNYGLNNVIPPVEEPTTNTYEVTLNGSNEAVLNSVYEDPSTPIEFIENGIPITNKINLKFIITANVIAPDGTNVGTFTGGNPVTFTASQAGTYVISYSFSYSGIEYTKVRNLIVK